MTKLKWKDLAEEARELVGGINDLLMEAQGGVVDGNDPAEDLKDAREDLRKAAKLTTRAIALLRKPQAGDKA